jgi:hypothetical protein
MQILPYRYFQTLHLIVTHTSVLTVPTIRFLGTDLNITVSLYYSTRRLLFTAALLQTVFFTIELPPFNLLSPFLNHQLSWPGVLVI